MVAIIPARGGSKGIPGKNIKSLCGKPLIAYSIEAALQAEEIERIVVTTDSDEIAAVSRRYGAEIPFIRPSFLAEDTSSAVDVYLHAIDYLQTSEGINIEKFVVLLPTAPLRDAVEIDNAVRIFKQGEYKTLVSMVKAEVPISWYFEMRAGGIVKNAGFDSKNELNNRQANQQYYIPNGAIYILDYELLKKGRTYYTDSTFAYIMDKNKSIDIDTAEDFAYAEFMMRCQAGEKL